MLPVITAFMAAHQLPDVTVVADAGMVSEANQKAIEAAGLSFILGARIPSEPYVVARWRRQHPEQEIPDGHIFTQPWPAGPNGGRRDQTIYYQYRHDRARRTRGIDEQVTKAEKAVAGQVPVKRNRFIRLTGGTRAVAVAVLTLEVALLIGLTIANPVQIERRGPMVRAASIVLIALMTIANVASAILLIRPILEWKSRPAPTQPHCSPPGHLSGRRT